MSNELPITRFTISNSTISLADKLYQIFETSKDSVEFRRRYIELVKTQEDSADIMLFLTSLVKRNVIPKGLISDNKPPTGGPETLKRTREINPDKIITKPTNIKKSRLQTSMK